MADPVLSPGEYLAGVGWLAVAGGALLVTVVTLRRRWLGTWPRLPAAVAAGVAGLLQVTLVGAATGAAGLLHRLPVLLGMVGGTAAVLVASRRARPVAPPPSPEPSPRRERWLAAAGVIAVGAQWLAHSADGLSRGMTHPDTLWYHAPYSARFLQLESLGDLGSLGYAQSRFFPLGSELLHAMVALPFHRDVLSPGVNLAFAALALAAAAAIGARWGAGALGVLLTTALLGLPTMAGTQPGQASNDIVAAALVLSALALYLHADRQVVPVTLAGAALGLAAGTKVTVLALLAPLALGMLMGLLVARRGRAAIGLVVGAVAPAIVWPLRNIVLVETPIPFVELDLGIWHNTAVAPPSGSPTLLRSLLDGGYVALRQGLGRGFGPLWPLVLLGLAGVALALWRGPSALRPAAVAAGIGAAAYVATPYTGGLSFQFNLRYLTPPLFLAAALLAAAASSLPRVRTAVAAVAAVVVVVNLFAAHHEGVRAWPDASLRVVVAWAVALVASTMLQRRATRVTRPALATVAVLATVAAVGGGWLVQQRFLEQRYVAAGLPDDPLNERFRTVTGATVEVIGSPEVYPMFGADLSNVVRDRTDEILFDLPVPDDPCRHWRGRVDAQYLAISSAGFVTRNMSPDVRRAIFELDPATTVLYADDQRALYRLAGALDPTAC